jgi:hypothetical protein
LPHLGDFTPFRYWQRRELVTGRGAEQESALQTEPRTNAAMPKYLRRFRLEDWSPLVGPEPEDWGGARLGTHWTLFRAHSMFMQARNEWRRQQRQRGRAAASRVLVT